MGRAGRKLTAGGLAAVVALACLFVVLRHPGGPLTVVSTVGSSMQPTLAPHTLVVVRSAARYEIGDVAAYMSEHLNKTVLHRIVETDGERYILQGDANEWLDPDRPSHDQLIGTAWLTVPGAGRLTQIPPLGLVGMLLAGMLLVGGSAARRSRPDAPRRRATRTSPTALALAIRATVPASLVLALATVVAVIAFTQPATQPGPITHMHQGSFSYTGDAAPGLVYPNGTVATGDTIFLSLVDEIEVTFTHALVAAVDHDMGGHGTLTLTVSDATGWRHTLEQSHQVEFDGPGGQMAVTIDPRELHALFERVEQETGLAASSRRVTAIAEIELTGTLAQTLLDTTLSHQMEFTLDEARMAPIGGELDVSQDGTVVVDGVEARTLDALGLTADVSRARTTAVGAGLAALLVLLACAVVRTRTRHADETTRIQARFAGAIIDVADIRTPDGRTVIELTRVDDLATLAETLQVPIVHRRWGDSDTFLADSGTTVYWYEASTASVNGEQSGAASKDPVAVRAGQGRSYGA